MSPTASVRRARSAFNAAWRAYNEAIAAEPPVGDRLSPAQQVAWMRLVQTHHELYQALRTAGSLPIPEPRHE